MADLVKSPSLTCRLPSRSYNGDHEQAACWYPPTCQCQRSYFTGGACATQIPWPRFKSFQFPIAGGRAVKTAYIMPRSNFETMMKKVDRNGEDTFFFHSESNEWASALADLGELAPDVYVFILYWTYAVAFVPKFDACDGSYIRVKSVFAVSYGRLRFCRYTMSYTMSSNS